MSGKPELLDDPRAPEHLVRATLCDIRRSNGLLGGTRAVVAAVDARWGAWRRDPPITALDVGSGAGDILSALARAAARRGIALRTTGVELNPTAARMTRGAGHASVCADGAILPLRDKTFDIVVMSQVLHHLPRPAAPSWISRLDRLARRLVVIADLRRAHAAAAGLWLASFPLRFHPVSRRDGVTSVYRGFTIDELRRLTERAGVSATVRRSAGFRVVAVWEPA